MQGRSMRCRQFCAIAGHGCHYHEYLVSFVDYDVVHNEWLPAANLANAVDLLRAYQVEHGLH